MVGAKPQPPHIRIPLRNQGFFITLLRDQAGALAGFSNRATESEARFSEAAEELTPVHQAQFGPAVASTAKPRGSQVTQQSVGATPAPASAVAPYSPPAFLTRLLNPSNMSSGTGKMMVLFFSTEISVRVWR